MFLKQTIRLFPFLSILFLCMGYSSFSFSQQKNKDSTKANIIILDNEYSEFIQSDGKTVQKLVNHVKLLHESDTLYCDTAYFYQSQNAFEAFGNVAIYQADSTYAYADYMRYTGNNKLVYMKGKLTEAELSDGKENSIWSKEIYYNLGSKRGEYRNGGTLQSDMTILSSRNAVYNMNTKEALFKGTVNVNDPDYQVVSSILGYNTESKVVTFSAPAIITNDKSILQTKNGTYDSKHKIGHFYERSSVLNEGQYIEADTLNYEKQSGLAHALGNVIALDTAQSSMLYCGIAKYNEISGILIAYQEPIMKTIDKNDSLFLKSDTFYSKPIIKEDSLTAQDSLQLTSDLMHQAVKSDSVLVDSGEVNLRITESIAQDTLIENFDTLLVPESDTLNKDVKMYGADTLESSKEKLNSPLKNDSILQTKTDSIKKKMDIFVYNDSLQKMERNLPDSLKTPYALNAQHRLDSTSYSYTNRPTTEDTNRPRVFIAYYNVLIFSDSLQGKCDSLIYSQRDSLMRMYVKPVLWQQNSQILGDVIYLQSANNKLKELIVPSNAIMISRSGPEKAKMFDQVQGNEIRGFFKENKLDSMTARPNASSIYFVKDDDDAYIGASEATSERIEIIFLNGSIQKIYYRTDVKQTMTPMKDVNPSSLRLERFKWREEERPESLESFLDGRVLPPKPELIKYIQSESSQI